jgi:hypothetical protein
MMASGIGGPGEGLRIFIGLGEEAIDGGLEIDDALEDAALEALPGQLGEEAFDRVEPGVRRGKQGERRASIWMRKCRRVRDDRRA